MRVAITHKIVNLAESARVPDALIRTGIRQLVRRRLRDVHADDYERAARDMARFVSDMDGASIAPLTELANDQHYEVPAAFFGLALGPHRKYSGCYWGNGADQLEVAEADALRITCDRAGIEDGMQILELGCGWGSLTLWLADQYRASTITAVSNSASQREQIERLARERGLSNLTVITADMNDFEAPGVYDRIVSVEMFEHMRNYRKLLRRVYNWLRPGGQLFVHIFCHRLCVYAFEDNGPQDWMSRYFFSGGIMPSADLLLRFQEQLNLRQRWFWNGTHYQKTANAWLANLDANADAALPILVQTYGAHDAQRWLQRWRLFFMAVAELFGYRNGQEWLVGHYLFERPAD
ncbi:MAG: cyclopropane-fatty-acyl-phospholipid synthase family protein [Pseudomonadota bacterium]